MSLDDTICFEWNDDHSITENLIKNSMQGLTERQGWKLWNEENGESITFKQFRKMLKMMGYYR